VIEPTIYHTRGEHDNYYTNDAVTIYDVNPVTILLKALFLIWKVDKIPIINEQIIPHEYGSVVVWRYRSWTLYIIRSRQLYCLYWCTWFVEEQTHWHGNFYKG